MDETMTGKLLRLRAEFLVTNASWIYCALCCLTCLLVYQRKITRKGQHTHARTFMYKTQYCTVLNTHEYTYQAHISWRFKSFTLGAYRSKRTHYNLQVPVKSPIVMGNTRAYVSVDTHVLLCVCMCLCVSECIAKWKWALWVWLKGSKPLLQEW